MKQFFIFIGKWIILPPTFVMAVIFLAVFLEKKGAFEPNDIQKERTAKLKERADKRMKERSDKRVKPEIDTLYREAQSLPSSDACGNLEKYNEVARLEQRSETSYYTPTTTRKIRDYSLKCDNGYVMEHSLGVDDKTAKLIRKDFLASFTTSTYLECGNETSSEPNYMSAGGTIIYRGDRLFISPPYQEKLPYEFIIRIAKDAGKINTYFEIYAQDKLNGSISYESFGTADDLVNVYGLNSWSLNRHSLIISRSSIRDRIEKDVDSKYGPYTIVWKIARNMSCKIFETDNLAKYLKKRGDEIYENTKLKQKYEEIKKQKALKAKEYEHWNATKI